MSEIHREPLQQRNLDEHEPEPERRRKRWCCEPARARAAARRERRPAAAPARTPARARMPTSRLSSVTLCSRSVPTSAACDEPLRMLRVWKKNGRSSVGRRHVVAAPHHVLRAVGQRERELRHAGAGGRNRPQHHVTQARGNLVGAFELLLGDGLPEEQHVRRFRLPRTPPCACAAPRSPPGEAPRLRAGPAAPIRATPAPTPSARPRARRARSGATRTSGSPPRCRGCFR